MTVLKPGHPGSGHLHMGVSDVGPLLGSSRLHMEGQTSVWAFFLYNDANSIDWGFDF